MMRVVHVSKSPFEVFLLAALVVSGIAGLINPHGSSAAIEALPGWARFLWYAGVAVASLGALVGALTTRLWSLFIERGSLSMLGVLLVAFAAAIVVVAGWIVAFSSIVTVGLAVACAVRVRQINVDIRRVLRGDGL